MGSLVQPSPALSAPVFWKGGPKPGCRTVGSGTFKVTASDLLPLSRPVSPERGWDFLVLVEFPGSLSVSSAARGGVFSFLLIRPGLGTESPILIMPRGSPFLPLST